MSDITLLQKSEYKKDIELLKYFLNTGKKIDIEKNIITVFKSADFIYPCTNEKLNLYYDKDLKNKRVLSVISSADHILHAALAGAKNIVGFDINRFCKYYSALKIAMIKKYNFEEFNKKYEEILEQVSWNLMNNLKHSNFFEKLIDEVSGYLTIEEKEFWKVYINIIRKNKYPRYLFEETDSCAYQNNNKWYDEVNYLELKNNLMNECNILYVDSNINNLKKNLEGTFDVIYISNILERINETDKKYNKECKEVLMYLNNLLNEEGLIYNYNFRESKIIYSDFNFNYFYDIKYKPIDEGELLTVFRKKVKVDYDSK